MTAAANPLDATTLKIEAARAALGHVEDGMRLGIGSGSTAEEFVKLLAERVAGGLKSSACRPPSAPPRFARSSACRCPRSTRRRSST